MTDATLAATAVAANTGNITVSATDDREITALVAALSASAALGNAVAIGASVAVNLIGWNGTVADETQDSHDPIVVTATVNGGSLTADSAVSIASASESTISATTAAVAVAIGISFGGGTDSGEQGTGGQEATKGEEGTVAEGKGGSPTSAKEEGEGKTTDAAGGETPTDVGQANGTTVDEGTDNAGGAETNQAEEGGAAAGESGNTAAPEEGAQKGSSTSILSGLGAGGGLLVGLGGVVSSASSGTTSSQPGPTYTTTDPTQSATDVQTLKTGDTVTLASNYDTATYSVGSGTTPTNTTVNPGDVVNDSGTLYRYIGANALTGVDFEVGATAPGLQRHDKLGEGRRHWGRYLPICGARRLARPQQSGLQQRQPVDRHHRRQQFGRQRHGVYRGKHCRDAWSRPKLPRRRLQRHDPAKDRGRPDGPLRRGQSRRARDPDRGEGAAGRRERQRQREFERDQCLRRPASTRRTRSLPRSRRSLRTQPRSRPVPERPAASA